MKSGMRLIFLTVALVLACWLVPATPAWALPNCDSWQGRACTSPGKLQVCSGLVFWYCECDADGLFWNCW